MRVCLSSRLLWWLFWNVRRSWWSFRSIRQSAVIFPLSSLLSSLYWSWDPLSSLESTPVSILVPKQVDCNMCRFSKLLLFFFFFCKDGSDRLMKRASFSCCNFLCVVLAAAYLKYRRCRLSCLPFVWHFFSLWHTHTRPVEGNGHFFPSCRQLYLSSFSDTQTLACTNARTLTHTCTEMGIFLFCTFLFIALAIFAFRACHSSGTLFSFSHTHTHTHTQNTRMHACTHR